MRWTMLILGLTLCYIPDAESAALVVAKAGDASIAHDAAAGVWTLTAGGATLTLALDAAVNFQAQQLVTTANRPWIATPEPDATVIVNGQGLPVGSRDRGFDYDGVRLNSSSTRLQLDAIFEHRAQGLRITRHYALTSGVPAFETWMTYEPLGASITLSNLNAFQLTVPAGTVRYVTGLMGDNADVETDSAFTRRQKQLGAGEHFTLGAQGRASEQTVPWFTVDGSSDEFFAAIMWSGAWTLSIDRVGNRLALSMGLPEMTTFVTTPTDGPHAIYGVVRGGLAQASSAMRSLVVQALRGGRALTPLVTYNTWFAYGTRIDESSMRSEMAKAATLGTELFVIDAGWYSGAGASGPFDFDAGLGTWEPDPTRFPNGLQPLTNYAHSLGMQFGIWVEPERVNLSIVGAPGPDQSWLATSGGSYGSDHTGQICLANAAARHWLLDRLSTLIDRAQPDYLKWDNNMWINCDRGGHGHGRSDGNFAHVQGLYDLLASLRAKYPNLLIENVSGGGNRLDLGMMRYTDVAWMDDRTAPSIHVRHNIEGLTAVFPPAYLLSFVTDHAGEPLHDAPDLVLYVRSRMAGALGLCFRGNALSADDTAQMSHEIGVYKSVRDSLGRAAATLLTAQTTEQNPPAWDVVQETASGTPQQLLLWAFQSNVGVAKTTIKPSGLTASTTYEVRSADRGILGTATGRELATTGIDIVASPSSAAHLLIVTAK